MHGHIFMGLVPLLILVCGAADRIIGWGALGRTKPVLVTMALLAGLAALMRLPPVSIVTFPIAFVIWRTPGWRLFGGSINPGTVKEDIGTFARHALALAFVLPAYWAGISPGLTALCMLGFAVIATALAIFNYYNQAHSNQFVETARGLALGLFLSLPYIILR